MMKRIPTWAVKQQNKLQKTRPKFQIGDIVMVNPFQSEWLKELTHPLSDINHRLKGLGVITGVSDVSKSQINEYSIDFGPHKGESAWHPEDALTFILPHLDNL